MEVFNATPEVIYRNGTRRRKCRMLDIYDIRRANLRKVLDKYYEGKPSRLAAALGKQPSQITRLFKPETESGRGMGDSMAREIEQTAGLEYGWMDHLHDPPTQAAFDKMSDDEQVASILREIAELNPEDVPFVRRLLSLLGSES